MNLRLAEWNGAPEDQAMDAMLACCGARRWAARMAALRPIASMDEMMTAADRVWAEMEEADWLEAFACHPRIGERGAARASLRAAAWSRQEQASTGTADAEVLSRIAAGNSDYEQRFGFTYIVCATGKSAEEILGNLKRRLGSDRAAEMREAAEQQRQITRIRLGKWAEE